MAIQNSRPVSSHNLSVYASESAVSAAPSFFFGPVQTQLLPKQTLGMGALPPIARTYTLGQESVQNAFLNWMDAEMAQIPFDKLKPEDLEFAVDALLLEWRQQLQDLVSQLSANKTVTWDLVYPAYHACAEPLLRLQQLLQILSAIDNKLWPDACKKATGKLSTFESELKQNQPVQTAFLALARDASLSPAQKRIVNTILSDAIQNGANLEPAQQAQFNETNALLTAAEKDFTATLNTEKKRAFVLLYSADRVAGLSDDFKARLAKNYTTSYPGQTATADTGPWLVKYMDVDLFLGAGTHAPTLETLSAAKENVGRGAKGTGSAMLAVQKYSESLAHLAGEPHYAAWSLKATMAGDLQNWHRQVDPLWQSVTQASSKYYATVGEFAKQQGGSMTLATQGYWVNRWEAAQDCDAAKIFAGKLVYQDVLAAYLADIEKLYAVEIDAVEQVGLPPGMTCYQWKRNGQVQGAFYLDVGARDNKTDMQASAAVVSRDESAVGDVLPVSYVILNFGGDNTALTVAQAEALAHELGHVVSNLASQGQYSENTANRGLEKDATEVASQFMEYFLAERVLQAAIADDGDTMQKWQAQRQRENLRKYAKILAVSRFDMEFFSTPAQDWTTQKMDERFSAIYSELGSNVPIGWPYRLNHAFADGYRASRANYSVYFWSDMIAADLQSIVQARLDQGKSLEEVGVDLQKFYGHGGDMPIAEAFSEFAGRGSSSDAFIQKLGLEPQP